MISPTLAATTISPGQLLGTLPSDTVIVTAPADNADFAIRVFAPRLDLPEDPVVPQHVPLEDVDLALDAEIAVAAERQEREPLSV